MWERHGMGAMIAAMGIVACAAPAIGPAEREPGSRKRGHGVPLRRETIRPREQSDSLRRMLASAKRRTA